MFSVVVAGLGCMFMSLPISVMSIPDGGTVSNIATKPKLHRRATQHKRSAYRYQATARQHSMEHRNTATGTIHVNPSQQRLGYNPKVCKEII